MFIDVDAPKSFIGGAKIDHGIVDGVIDFWNDCDYLDKEEGHTGHGVDKSMKDSIDLTLPRYIKDKVDSKLGEDNQGFSKIKDIGNRKIKDQIVVEVVTFSFPLFFILKVKIPPIE